MKNEVSYLETSTGKYPICFNLNVMEAIQDEYGTMSKWGEIVEDKNSGEPKIKDLKVGLLAMINEGIDIENENNDVKKPEMNSKQLGRIISEVGFTEIVKTIKSITIKSTSTGEQSKNE